MDSATIQEFIGLKRIAIVGVSRLDRKYGSIVYRNLRQQGYEVVPVNPEIDTFDGEICYPDLSSVPEPVDAAVIIISPFKVAAILHEAAELGIQHVWLQPGAETRKSIDLGQELGLDLVHTYCVMVEARKHYAFRN